MGMARISCFEGQSKCAQGIFKTKNGVYVGKFRMLHKGEILDL
jgi:hypothetical protein